MMEATPELRIIRASHDVLQQKWAETTYVTNNEIIVKEEWRDVPIVFGWTKDAQTTHSEKRFELKAEDN